MKKVIISLAILSLLLLVGCKTLAEEVCEEFEGDLIDRYHCDVGDENSTYKYGIICGKDTIRIYSNKEVDISMPLRMKLQCGYVKVKIN